MKKVDILGIKVSSITQFELDNFTRETLENKSKKLILYSNIYGMNLIFKHRWMAELFNRSDILLCDGAGVKWGSQILGTPIRERITLTDWGWDLADILVETGSSIFLLGSEDKVAAMAVDRLKKRYPNLNIAGYHHGFFNVENEENINVMEKINSSGSDVLLLGMGMPRQEKWIYDNMKNINSKIIITGGAVFNYFAGIQKRSPKWVSKIGMEWLHRLLHDPVKLFPRYFPGNFTFLFRIIKHRIFR